jgi:hypothetical protein
MLVPEIERPAAILEERDEGAAAGIKIGMQHLDRPAGGAAADRQRGNQRAAQEILVELPGLLGIPAAKGAMVNPFGHAAPFRAVSVASGPLRRKLDEARPETDLQQRDMPPIGKTSGDS